MRKLILVLGGLIICVGNLRGRVHVEASFEDTLAVYEGIFKEDEPIHITLKFNIKSFQRSRAKEKYLPADMTYQVNDTFQVTHPVRIKARGIFRRGHCSIPPFWLNIRYSGIEAEALAGIQRMKMVTHCKKTDQYAAYVLKEYLVYRIYNIISPYSYATRLVRITYIDTGRDNKLQLASMLLI